MLSKGIGRELLGKAYMETQIKLQNREVWRVPMLPSKIQVFLNEFPWIKGILEGQKISCACVSKISLEFLSITPHNRQILGGEEDIESIFFFDTKYNLIKHRGFVVIREFWRPWRTRQVTRSQVSVRKDESVEEFIGKIGDRAADILYAVSWSQTMHSLIIYKPPQGFTLMGWIDELRRREIQQIREDIAAIDAEAKK